MDRMMSSPEMVPVGLENDLLLRMPVDDDDDEKGPLVSTESSLKAGMLGELDKASGRLFMSLEVGSSNA